MKVCSQFLRHILPAASAFRRGAAQVAYGFRVEEQEVCFGYYGIDLDILLEETAAGIAGYPHAQAASLAAVHKSRFSGFHTEVQAEVLQAVCLKAQSPGADLDEVLLFHIRYCRLCPALEDCKQAHFEKFCQARMKKRHKNFCFEPVW